MRLVRDNDFVQEDVQVSELPTMGPAMDPDELRDRVAEPQDGPVEPQRGDSLDDEAVAPADLDVDLGILESLLFSTHHPLTAGRLAELMELDTTRVVRQAIKLLNDQYESTGRAFRIEQVAGGYQLLTLPEYGEYLKKMTQREADAKLTKAALETLAIIAYRQPILRADVEAIRGVACGETIRSLMEKRLVKIAGRAEEPGRPILYGTTKRFLEVFGLNSTKDLPQMEEAFAQKPKIEPPQPEPAAAAPQSEEPPAATDSGQLTTEEPTDQPH